MKLYNFLVNRHTGIAYRYHKRHDGTSGLGKLLSWLYLLWLNFAYYILFFRFLGRKPGVAVYEEKKLPIGISESEQFLDKHPEIDVDTYVDKLAGYGVISFDIFDTLIFRPFSEPTDLFFMLGGELGIMNFKEIRMRYEQECRMECYEKNGHYEVRLEDIWNKIEREIGIPAAEGMRIEKEYEYKLCYANPFMKKVYNRLISQGKKIIIISDMYLPGEFLEKLLKAKGYGGFFKLYVSCDYGKSKGNGQLYQLAKSGYDAKMCFDENTRFIHVGDNEISDVKRANEEGWDTLYYPNVNRMSLTYRTYDLSPIIGGAYRGLVNNHIYCGVRRYGREYEYGYIYGGLFVTGYCNYIHTYCRQNNIDKILFLSRDGDILKQAYDCIYGTRSNTEYVYWSRKAATRLEFSFDMYDYFRRFIFHKVNQGISVKDILRSMELDDESFIEGLERYEYKRGTELSKKKKHIGRDDVLTSDNADILKNYIIDNREQVEAAYSSQNMAAREYYGKVLAGCKRAVAVDIGWAGSGSLVLRKLVSDVWKLDCEITGIIAGTNTIYNAEPEASEIFLQDGSLVSYMYSQSVNRDLLKKHDLNKDYNLYWELLLSSPTPQFTGFDYKDGEIIQKFGKYDHNPKGIMEIQKGIMDFVRDYCRHFGDYGYMFDISGRDAYAPMLLAASYNERYLRDIYKNFKIDINV